MNGNDIALDNGAAIDLGGIAKGYASDRVKDILKKHGIRSGLISFGSAIQAVGSRPDGSDWRIGVTDPKNTDEHIARITMSDKCIATSGSYEQVWRENGGFDAVFVTDDNDVYYTEGIAGPFSAADEVPAVMITK